MKVGKIKQLSKKSLSVLLAVIMIMSSMSVAFGSVTFAAGGSVSDAKWNEFIAALKNDTVKNASFNTSSANNYTVTDPDGKIIAAIELYFEIFDTLADKAPSSSSAGNRTINQVNTSIKNTLSSKMSADYGTYNIDSFITKLISGADVSINKGSKRESESNSAPGTNLSAVADIKLNVILGGELTKYDSIEELPNEIATTKTFTVKHTNTYYDTSTRTENTTDSCGNVTGSKTYYGFEYFYSISSVAEAEGAKQSTQVLKTSASTLTANSKYLDANLDQMVQFIISDAAAVAAAKTAIDTAKKNATDFSQAAWNQYFKASYDSKITALASNITLATEIVGVGEVVYPLTLLKDAGCEGMSEAQLRSLYSKLTEGLSKFDTASADAQNYISTHKYEGVAFVRSDIDAFAKLVYKKIQTIELEALKQTIEATVPAYESYNEDDVISGAISGAILSVAKGNVDGFIKSINTYPSALVAEVMGDIPAYLSTLLTKLNHLIKVANYDDQFSAEYAYYVSEVHGATDLSADSEILRLALTDGYDAWYTGLKNLISTIESQLGADLANKIMTTLDDEMKAHMDDVYTTLHERVLAQIDNATALYAVVKALNGSISIINLNNYSKYKRAFDSLDRETYDFLKSTPNFSMPQSTIDKYNALKGDFDKYNEFIASGGFEYFAQQSIDYADREVLANDIIRDTEYDVTKAKIENVIKGLDKLISSEEIGSILGGLLGTEEGAEFNISTMLKELIADALFSDSLINTIMQALYPLVLGELLKVWEKDLPTQITDPVTANITYNKAIDVISVEAGLPLFPSDVADSLDKTKYAENIAMLKSASKYYETHKTFKDDGTIDEVIVDQTPWTEENPNLFNEDGTLKLTWGVDAAKQAGKSFDEIAETFYQGFDDALHCLKPLLNVLIANTAWNSNQVKDVASISAKIIWTINDNAHLTINASACAGYANLLVPLFEALGARVEGTQGAPFTFKAPSVIESYAKNTNGAADMLRAIFEPIFGLVDYLAVAPLDAIISLLPNLCYALQMQMLPSLLGMLQTTLTIGVQLSNQTLQGCVGDMLKNFLPAMDLNVAEMVGDVNDLIDLSDGVNSLLSLLGLPLPAIEQGLIAQLGTMGKFTSARYATAYDKSAITKVTLGNNEAITINADKAAVGYYLLTYIFGILNDEDAFKGLLGMLMTIEQPDGTKVPDEAKIEETIASFNEMGLFSYGTGNAIAAIVELFNQEPNTNFSVYDWYEDPLFNGTVTGLTPAMVQYLSYDNDLTKEKTAYIVEHLDELISSIIDMVNGNPEGTYSIAAKLDELIGGALFTNANITAVAKALSALDLNALLAGTGNAPETVAEGEESEAIAIDVTALVKDLIGIDLSAFAAYADIEDDYDWGVTDGKTFASALAGVLAPLNPLLDFILKGENLKLLDSDTGAVITLLGSNGYDTAIVPLLEALGCEVKTLEEDDNAIEVILLSIITKLETITGEGADAVAGLADLLPGVLYFLQSNALAAVVDNLLHPIYQLLDTIRPIYELNFDEILGTLLASLPIELDLNNLDIDFVLGLVKDMFGLDFTDLGVVIADMCKVAVTPYESKSSIIGKNGKKGAYTKLFDATDLVAVILNFAFDWFTVEENVNAMANVIGGDNAATVEKTKKYIAGIYALIAGIEPEYGTIDWAYNFPEGFDEAIFSSGITVTPTIESLNYPTNWTEETAKYVTENLDALIASALKMAGVEGTLSDMLKSKINLFTGENLNTLVAMLTDLLGKLNTEIVNNAGVLIGADLETLRNYKAEKETYTTVEFAQELAKILGVIPEVVNLIFFDDDFEIFNYASGATVGTIKGSEGYAKGLAPILEALGCKNLPAADSKDVEGILVSIANRFDEILNDPINEALELLPNLIFFINANGISVSVKNILATVTAFMAQLKESFGVDVDLIAIINDALNGLLPEDSEVVIDANNLDLATVFALVQELIGLDLTAASDILVDLCVGKIEAFESISGDYGFRMVYNDDYAKYDMITILVTIALMVVDNEENAAALDKMIGTDIMSALSDVFASAPVVYATPDWNYPLADNGTVDAMKYSISYPNNWTLESAQYVAENIVPIGDMIAGVIDSNYSTLGALVSDKVKIYSSENIDAIVSAITGFLTDIDDTLLEAAGLLLDADVVGLKKYKAPAGIDTAEEFASELANVLTTYAGGLVDWLLFGEDYRFFVDERIVGDKYEDGEEIITINGGFGYANGLALILEALGVKNLPAADSKDVEGILTVTFARLDEILANPAEEVFALLPNLLYFLNANGVAIAFDNLLAAVTTLLNKLTVFGLELDMATLIDIEGLLSIEEDLMISIDNLTVEAILELVAYLTGFDFDLLKDVLVGFGLGAVQKYDSISRAGEAYQMYYDDEFAVYDMITVLANLVILTVKDEDNAEKFEELLGEEVYQTIINVFNMGEVPVQEFDWKFKEKADTGYVFSAIETSKLYSSNHKYGPLYTEEMAQYIATNVGEFIDNIIYLLGISIDGKSVDDLKELINGLVNGSLYNSENVIAIRDALAGVLAGIGDLEVNGAKVGGYIAEVLKTAGVADINAVATVEVPEFTEDRAQFTQYLCEVLKPLYPVLKWVLSDEDISFFVNLDKTDAIVLKGAEGYAYGIIPLLETLECQGILAPEEYYAAVAKDSNVVLTSILDPLFDRIDVIMENPADEILSMLPNLIYFINSNGVDTVVKNTLNAVYTLLAAIEPIAKIDLYELIGLDLSTLTFEKLFDMLLDMIAESTGYEFSNLGASAVAELTVGTLVSYNSLNGKTAYKMIYQSEVAANEMVTVVMRLMVTFIMHENNREMLIGLLRDYFNMTADAEKYVRGILDTLAACSTETYLGMDKALATIYYLFYGADVAIGETTGGIKDLNAEWQQILINMGMSDDPNEQTLGNLLAEFLDVYFEDVLTSEGIAPNGLLAFFQKIVEWFQKIIDWFSKLFG